MITFKQREVLLEINKFILNNHYSPSVRELVTLVNVKSSATIQGHLNRLEREGYITRIPSMPRTVRVLKNPEY